MLPSSFFLGVVAPMYLKELDGFGVNVSFLCFQYLDLFLLVKGSYERLEGGGE
jgi:hypothetical protein